MPFQQKLERNEGASLTSTGKKSISGRGNIKTKVLTGENAWHVQGPGSPMWEEQE